MSKLTKAEAFAKIKKLLGLIKFENSKMADGTLLQWEGELAEGTAINVIGEDGNSIPAEDATHTLEDGSKITTVGGLVTKIEPKEMMPVEDSSEFAVMFATHLEAFNSLLEKFTALETKIAEYDSKFAEINQTVTDTTKDTGEKFAKVIELVEAIGDEPVKVEKPVNVTYKKTPNKASAIELFKRFEADRKKTN